MSHRRFVLIAVVALLLVYAAGREMASGPASPSPAPEAEEAGEEPEAPIERPGVQPDAPDPEAGDVAETPPGDPGKILVRVVTEDGVPIPGAKVVLLFRGENAPSRVGETDAEGRWLFEGLPEKLRCTVRASGSLYLVPASRAARPAIDPPAEVLLELREGGAVSGEVVDEAGILLDVPFTISVHPRGPRALTGIRILTGRTLGGDNRSFPAGAGAFVVGGLQSGRYVAGCWAEGFENGWSEPFTVARGATAGNIRIVLTRGGSVSGVVVRMRTGEPVSDATVSLVRDAALDMVVMSGSSIRFGAQKEESTDEQGRFRIDGVAPGKYGLLVTADDLSPQRVRDIVVAKGEEAGGILVSLGEGGGISGTVYGPDGEPVSGAEVLVSRIDGRVQIVGDFGRKIKADEKGVYFVEHLEPGDYRVKRPTGGNSMAMTMSVRITGMGQPEERPRERDPDAVVVREGEVTRHDLFDEQSGSIHGLALYRDGRPIAGMVSLRAISDADAPPGPLAHITVPRMTRPDKDGRFVFRGLPPGDYLLIVLGARRELTLTAGETKKVDFRIETTSIGGVVRDEEGSPVAGARVSLTRIEEPGAGRGALLFRMFSGSVSETDEKGRFRFPDAAPGRYRVKARKGAANGESHEFYARAGEDGENVEVYLETAVSIRVEVLDEKGNPVKGARVSFTAERGGAFSRGSVTDERGIARASLTPGRYRPQVQLGQKRLPVQPAEIVVGRSRNQTFTLR